ncbi:MAG TPA: helical backbone metal receptor [Planctomycetota bacterium]|nr:helical backbone metal receptor [Planctomycetota bacterium]
MLPSLETIRRSPRRIVCIAPSNTEILYALGAADRIVGVSRFCDFPPEAREKPRCGGFLDPKIEEIIKLKPDLVLAQSFLQENAVKALAHHEIRVVCFSCTSLAELLEDILLLGRWVEREREADALVTRMHAQLLELGEEGRRLTAGLGRRPRVHLEEWGPSEPYYLAGDWAAEMLGLAGADNAFGDRNLRCPSAERTCTDAQIAAADPDVVIAAWCGCGEKVDLTRIARRPALVASRVVQAGWLRVVDDRFVMRPGPRVVEGVRRMQAIVEEWVRAQA